MAQATASKRMLPFHLSDSESNFCSASCFEGNIFIPLQIVTIRQRNILYILFFFFRHKRIFTSPVQFYSTTLFSAIYIFFYKINLVKNVCPKSGFILLCLHVLHRIFSVPEKKKKCRVTYNIGHVALGRVKVILPSHCQSITFQLAQKVERLPCKGSNTWFCA